MADTSERPAFRSSEVTSMIRGGGLDIEIAPAGDLTTEEMILNIGPQHPSTHGVLRVVLELDGEVITRAEPVIGYMHRAAEKLAEYRDARQVLVLMNRHDWLSARSTTSSGGRSRSSVWPASRCPIARSGSARCSRSGTGS